MSIEPKELDYLLIKERNELRAEIEGLRAAYNDAVTRQKARRNAIIEECARFVKEYAAWRQGNRIDDVDNLIAAIRAMKDKP